MLRTVGWLRGAGWFALAAMAVPFSSAQAQAGDYIYLRCDWRDQDGASGSDIFRIRDGEFSRYFPNDGGWSNFCLAVQGGDPGSLCSLTDNRFFAQVAQGSGSDRYLERHEINRINGAYSSAQMMVGASLNKTGQCARTVAPSKPVRQF